MAQRWAQRPEGSTWGDWGDDDQLGRLNLLTPQKVREGVAEVREGIAFCLSLPLDYPGSSVLNLRRQPPELAPSTNADDPISIIPWAATSTAPAISCATTGY